MIDQVKEKINTLLNDGVVTGVVALATAHGHITPHLFKKGDDLDSLSLGDHEREGDARYPLNKVLITLARKYPEEKFGVLVRGCDERGLYGLFRLKQLTEERVIPVGIACSKDLAKACECKKPWPDALVAGEKTDAPEASRVKELEAKDVLERFVFWSDQFLKCVKCYGCRDICPMCFCYECSLECDDLVSKGDLPVDIPVFHLTRAMHMADRCVDCGLCDEACPSDIPLRLLYKKTAETMKSEFGFTSGLIKDEKSPLSVMGPSEKNAE
jgi:formate dehydrogenase subunit beta